MASRIVIAGAGGQVGSFLAAEATRQGRDVLALTSSQWDIADPQRAGEIVQPGDVVINCAAYTAVDDAEARPGPGLRGQRRRPGTHRAGLRAGRRAAGAHLHRLRVRRRLRRRGAAPYEPDDETRPLSVYGQTKLSGEQAVLAALPEAVVVRTAWVYTGGDGKDFVAAMRRLAAGDGVVDMVDDQTGSPTYAADLVGALLEVADGRVRRPERHRARRQRRRGHPIRAGPRSVRDPRRRPGAGPAGEQRPQPATGAAAGVFGAVRSASQAAGLTPLRPWREALEAALRGAAGCLTATLDA